MINNFKPLLICLCITIILFIASLINKNFLMESGNEVIKYNNEIEKKIRNNDFTNINYQVLYKDISDLDNKIKNSFKDNDEINLKTDYFKNAAYVFDNKIKEIVSVLNQFLDDEDFHILQDDIDEFYDNLDFAVSDMGKMIKSSVEYDYNKNKYIYEEKKIKCYELLELYKGFLK